MKTISLWLLVFTFAVCLARGQDDATQQQINKLSGQIQDLIDAQAVQAKRIDALEKEIGESRDKSSQPSTTPDTANAEYLKKLDDQVQEIDKKRQADKELILKEIEKLGKVGSSTPVRRSTPTISTNPPSAGPGPGGKQSGYEYT